MSYPKCYIADGCGADETCVALCPTATAPVKKWQVVYRDTNTGNTRHSTPTPVRAQADQLAAATSRQAITEGETVEIREWDGNPWEVRDGIA